MQGCRQRAQASRGELRRRLVAILPAQEMEEMRGLTAYSCEGDIYLSAGYSLYCLF